MRRKCYGLPVRLPYIVITCARMVGTKRFCYYPLCRICVPSDVVSVHDSIPSHDHHLHMDQILQLKRGDNRYFSNENKQQYSDNNMTKYTLKICFT